MPTIPTMSDILSDWRRHTRNGREDVHFQTVRVVSRWIRCGHELATLPLMLSRLTPDLIAEGVADAASR